MVEVGVGVPVAVIVGGMLGVSVSVSVGVSGVAVGVRVASSGVAVFVGVGPSGVLVFVGVGSSGVEVGVLVLGCSVSVGVTFSSHRPTMASMGAQSSSAWMAIRARKTLVSMPITS
jgi:hypothetical protein